jgi:hypothetical protein
MQLWIEPVSARKSFSRRGFYLKCFIGHLVIGSLLERVGETIIGSLSWLLEVRLGLVLLKG